MVPFPLLSLLLLSGVREVAASFLFGRQRPPSDGATTPALETRQGTALFTTIATIYAGGDVSQARTANKGFDIRVDLANTAFGFCDSNNLNQCDMAGTCVDDFSCSGGCGFGNTALVTWTW
jgi:hypothetical protein